MSQETKPKAPVSVSGAIIMPYVYAAGATGSRFFIELRDNKKIMGTRCPQCKRTYVPPRSICASCFINVDEWVELEGSGTVESYTVVNYSLPVHPLEPPFVYGIIKLDGADTGIAHFLGEVDPKEVKIGLRVRPVFKEKGEGNILDIKYFKPIRQS